MNVGNGLDRSFQREYIEKGNGLDHFLKREYIEMRNALDHFLRRKINVLNCNKIMYCVDTKN